MRPFAEYLREFDGLTAGEAINLLTEFGSVQERIIAEGGSQNISTTPMRMCFKLPGDTPANDIGPIQFCGGPPGQYTWVVGTLLTLVIDKVMHFDAHEELMTRKYGMKIAPGC